MALSGAAVVILDRRQVALARRIKAALPGAAIHGPASLEGDADVTYERLASHLPALFRRGTPIVGICAAGILIRLLAPHLADKSAEPPVIAVSEDGQSVVPLLGGHHGANRLTRTIAVALGARAAITTAGDTALGFALDAPPPGWRLGEGALVKEVTAALLAGEPVRLVTEAASADWLTAGGAPFGDWGRLTLRITDRSVVPGDDVADVTLHPAVLALGLGCERGCAPKELILLAKRVLVAGGLAPEAVACVASLDLKADEPAVSAVAAWLGVPLRLFDAATLERETPRLTAPSDVVFRAVGCHGVAEAAALACAGAEGTLAMPKARSERGTCAIARAATIIDPERCGRGRGRVTVVGIGPGAQAWRTPGADAAIAGATDLVGYSRYLDLLGPPPPGCARHAYPIGAEEKRARAALALAAEGRRVALVSSGDAGVYGMASLLFELLDGEAVNQSWRGIELAVEPGISALQAAAARAGAPIGHDFCAISLSDLLTPWPEIARRLRAAAEADFVVALYNPASRQRRSRLAEARNILATHRRLDCPVVVARNLGREGERVDVTTLAGFDAKAVDMLTVIVVGNSQTRRLEWDGRAWLYTPRGYAPGDRGEALRDEERVTVHFIGAGPGAAGPDHRAGAHPAAALPRRALCGLAGAADDPRGSPGGCAHRRHRTARSRRDYGRDGAGGSRGPRGRAAAFRRSLPLWRYRRADAPPRPARHPLRRDPRRARLCGRGGGAQTGTDAPRYRPDRDPDADRRARLIHARRRAAGAPRRCRRHARHPPLDQQPREGDAHADPAPRGGLPHGRRLPRELARRADRARNPRRPSGTR